jgi:isopenicillin-N N-acyltransferase-like protein
MSFSLKEITLSGSPAEIGFQHGAALSEQIKHNIAFYRPLFLDNLGSEARVLELAGDLKDQIAAFNPDYITEIDHIARGAQLSEPLWLYALNARTELTLTRDLKECTAVVFPQTNKIGQTWDWSGHLEDHFVIMEINFPSGHQKIGLNNRGLGQTLNILWSIDHVLLGVPIHILLRAILESPTLEDAKKAVERSGGGKASNIIAAQAGRAFDAEFSGNETILYDIPGKGYAHTNHYLHSPRPIPIDETDLLNSLTRYETAQGKINAVADFSIADMIAILSDRSRGENSILTKYQPATLMKMGFIGTLATIVMDLTTRTMLVRKGNPASARFEMDGFSEFRLT